MATDPQSLLALANAYQTYSMGQMNAVLIYCLTQWTTELGQ